MPFAGITFLWFIAVVRDGFGRLEDKFFTTVFLGSGLLFLAMMFSATAVGVALSSSARSRKTPRRTPKCGVRPDTFADTDENLCAADGGGVHDLAGHHLAEDGTDAALAVGVT